MLIQDFREDFYYMVDRIFNKKQPTAFVRYNEGEASLLLGKAFIGARGIRRTYDDKEDLRIALLIAVRYAHNDFFYGIATQQHQRENEFMKRKIKSENITFATLFANANREMFKLVIEKIQEPVIIVGNQIGKYKKYPFFVEDYLSIPDDVVAFYQKYNFKVRMIQEKINKYKNHLVFFCAGPLSNIMIYNCWKRNKTNRLIDLGSTLDKHIYGIATRKYFNKFSKTHNQIDIL